LRDFSWLPVGHTAPGDWFPGHLYRAVRMAARISAADRAVQNHFVAARLVGVSGDVLLRFRKTAERRPGLAQTHRAELPLRNPASAHLDGLVHAPTTALVSQTLGRLSVRHRAGRPVVRFPPASV